jgi:high-affinity Fe2+/Pb2+ permease
MKRTLKNGWNSFLKLFRFLAWYGIAVAAIFYLLPMAGVIVQDQYEALSGTVKFIAILGFFSVVGAWQILSRRDRWREWPAEKSMG